LVNWIFSRRGVMTSMSLSKSSQNHHRATNATEFTLDAEIHRSFACSVSLSTREMLRWRAMLVKTSSCGTGKSVDRATVRHFRCGFRLPPVIDREPA